MIVREMTPQDVREHDKVSAQAFCYPCDIEDKTSCLPCNKMLGAFAQNGKTLFADMEINVRGCFFGTGLLRCAAVGGVAAKPEYRGKGAVKALFDALHKSGEFDVAILYPFAEAYYRKLGYERLGLAARVTVPFGQLSTFPRNGDAVLFEGNNPEELLALYNRLAQNYTLCFLRENTEAFPAKPFLQQEFTYVWQSRAYATFTVSREKSTVFVREIFWDSFEGMRGILGFLRNFEGNQKYLCIEKIPVDSPLLACLAEIKECAITLQNTGSARILHTENVLKTHSYPAGEGQFSIQIADDYADTAGIFDVNYRNSGVQVTRRETGETDAILNISAASRILLGGIENAEKAAYINGVQINNTHSDFFKAFPLKTVLFTDCF